MSKAHSVSGPLLYRVTKQEKRRAHPARQDGRTCRGQHEWEGRPHHSPLADFPSARPAHAKTTALICLSTLWHTREGAAGQRQPHEGSRAPDPAWLPQYIKNCGKHLVYQAEFINM